MIDVINTTELEHILNKCSKLILIECYTLMTIRAYLLELSLHEILVEWSDLITAYKIDIENYKTIPIKYNLFSYISLLFFNNKRFVDHLSELILKNAILSKIEKMLDGLT